MLYNYKGEDYLLHLVDTPGHVDFRAEVFNILNHPNYANPGNLRLNQTLATAVGNGSQPGTPFTLSNAGSAGQLTSTVGNQVGIGANRQIQLSLRMNF